MTDPNAPDIAVEIPLLAGDEKATALRDLLAKAQLLGARYVSPAIKRPDRSYIVGLWIEPDTAAVHDARLASLQAIQVLQGAELAGSLGISLSNQLFVAAAQKAWDDPQFQKQKTLADMGNYLAPDPGDDGDRGDIHLDSMNVTFVPPAHGNSGGSVVTTIGGHKEWQGIAAPVGFTLEIVDSLTAEPSDGRIHVTSTPSISYSPLAYLLLAASTFLLGAFTGIAWLAITGWVGTGLVGFGAAVLDAVAAAPQGVTGGVGSVIAGTLPSQVLMPGTSKKQVFAYQRVLVGAERFSAVATPSEVARVLAPTIATPRNVSTVVGKPVTKYVNVTNRDDMTSPIRFTWTSSDAAIDQPDSPSVFATYDPGAAKAGDVLRRHIAVSMVDADGNAASAQAEIQITVDAPPAPPPRNPHVSSNGVENPSGQRSTPRTL